MAVPLPLTVAALGFVVAGVFPQNAAYGFPVGTPDGPAVGTSWHAQVHTRAAVVAFLGIALAAVVSTVRAFRGHRQRPSVRISATLSTTSRRRVPVFSLPPS